MPNRQWTREEVLLTINLYCKLPYGRLNKTTPEIIELANLLRRTPSAISMRCCNYVQFDPVESKRVKGFVSAAKLDRAIWTEIKNDWEKFAVESEMLLEKLRSDSTFIQQIKPIQKPDLNKTDLQNFPIGENISRNVRVRTGQSFFRKTVLATYNYQCCVSGIHNNTLLNASHIKPWRDSDPKTERTNPANGLCLSPLYDKTFDIGLMTIDEKYRIIFSKTIYDCANKETVRNFFKCYEGNKLNLPDRFCPDQTYLDYHRNKIFQY